MVILTRSDDNGIYDIDSKTLKEKKVSDLKNRVKIGNESSADMFISIHLNKISDQEYYGWQTFYKSSDENSIKLAKGDAMHELGVLSYAVKTVDGIAEKNGVKRIKFITLEIGTESGFVPEYLEKLYPVATDGKERFKGSELKIEMVSGKGLVIKEIGCQTA
jgi:N-acetylmuramoyl-L-alanine amidase